MYESYILMYDSYKMRDWSHTILYESYKNMYDSYIFFYDSYIKCMIHTYMYDLKVWENYFSQIYLNFPIIFLEIFVKDNIEILRKKNIDF